MMLSVNNASKKYSVQDENAYIVFVSRSTRNLTGGFDISWQYSGTKIIPPKEEADEIYREDEQESIQVCVYNITAAAIEFKKSEEDMFKDFREVFARLSQNFAKEKGLTQANIRTSSIEFYRVSKIIWSSESPNNTELAAFSARLKVKGYKEGSAAFTNKQLQEVFNKYLKEDTSVTGYKVKKCPDDAVHSAWWSKGVYASLAVFFCLFLAMWALKTNRFSISKCSNALNSSNKSIFHDSVHALFSNNEKDDPVAQNAQLEENEYARCPGFQSSPKVRLTTGKGRTYTVDLESDDCSGRVCSDRDSDISSLDAKGSSNDLRKSAGASAESGRKNGSSWNFQGSSSDQNGLFMKELKETKNRENEAEHVYDSVASSLSSRREQDTQL